MYSNKNKQQKQITFYVYDNRLRCNYLLFCFLQLPKTSDAILSFPPTYDFIMNLYFHWNFKV